MTVLTAAIAVALLTPEAHGQSGHDADLPSAGAIGDTLTVDGTLADTCRRGMAEIGFDPDSLDTWEGADPRSGDEIVVAKLAEGGGEPFTASFRVPPLEPSPGKLPGLYLGCVTTAPFHDFLWTATSFSVQETGTATTPALLPRTDSDPGGGVPVGTIAGGLSAALLVGAALAVRAVRRGRRPPRRSADHIGCVTRHEAASKGATAAKARLDSDARTAAEGLMSALDELATEIDGARPEFDLLGESVDEQAEVVNGLLDAIVEELP